MKKPVIVLLALLFFSCAIATVSCTKQLSTPETAGMPDPKGTGDRIVPRLAGGGFEISYWIDIDVRSNNGRGYWFHKADRPADSLPTSAQIWGAASRCRFTYHGLTLYVIYHRQFEISDAKTVLQYWKTHAESMGMKVVPVVVLEDYASPAATNFTDTEIPDFAEWCITNINADEFGVYDIYHNRQGPGTAQNTQLGIIKTRIGNKIVRIGLQPGESLNPNIRRGVQDTWSAECQGLTNTLWETPVSYGGTTNYGRNLLMNWVNDRVVNDSNIISWCLIPVAWDYDAPVDPYGYISPGDDALTNDPPVPGRVTLCHNYIVGAYPGGSGNAKFGGYSCDLRILQLNSAGKPESPTFYERIRADQLYTGYFSGAMNEIGGIYSLYDH